MNVQSLIIEHAEERVLSIILVRAAICSICCMMRRIGARAPERPA